METTNSRGVKYKRNENNFPSKLKLSYVGARTTKVVSLFPIFMKGGQSELKHNMLERKTAIAFQFFVIHLISWSINAN